MIVQNAEQIRNQASIYRAAGTAICLTSGTFDWFHYGHLRCLQDTLSLPSLLHGDERPTALFIAVNDDLSYRTFKHKSPIFTVEERAFLLDSIKGVSLVIPFGNPDPRYVITTVRPHYYVKGNEYKLEDLPEREALEQAGTIFIPRVPVPNYRTSELLRKENTT